MAAAVLTSYTSVLNSSVTLYVCDLHESFIAAKPNVRNLVGQYGPRVCPYWPTKMRTSSSQEEGVVRDFGVATVRFEGENGVVKKLVCARADDKFQPIPGTEFELQADLVLLAMGFLGPVQDGMIKDLGLALDKRGNVLADTVKYQTDKQKVFSCGDMRRGQSLVVWAIREGRQCARAIDLSLMGETTLPR
eukprot:gene9844-13274_t